jgi:hypothetical protein
MSGLFLSLAKTSSATKNGAILGSEGMNTISIASKELGDFGRQGPQGPGDPWAPAAHIHIYKDGRKVGPD